jgi:SAM-dependent methyltransferase
MSLNSTKRFSNRVDHYIKYRPTYPRELLTFLESAISLTPQKIIADIGSGTGISTRLLLSHGNPVYAIEPNAEMRAAAEAALGTNPNFHSVDASASATSLAPSSVDVVTAMQAFHWFEPLAAREEFSRILKSGGWVVLVWNDRRTTDSAFLKAYEALLLEFATDYRHVRSEHPSNETFNQFFAPAGYGEHALANEQAFDFDGLAGRLLSSSYAPAQGHPGHEPMMAELRRIFERHQAGGVVRFIYDTRIYYGHVGSVPHGSNPQA